MSGIDQETSGHWMVRLADSELFRKLPAANVRALLERIEKTAVSAGDVIIEQGDPGDYYYVVEQGRCQVTREHPDGTVSELATLARGDAFGEEEMVSAVGRNATVTMQTDGELLRLAKDDFVDIVRDPLVDKIPFAIAQRMHSAGALWLDVRSPDEFAKRTLPDAINVPLANLREVAPDLLKDQHYVVCADDWASAAISTLLLAQRGFEAVCMTETLSTVLGPTDGTGEPGEISESVVAFPATDADDTESPATPPPVNAARREETMAVEDLHSTEPIPRDLYDDTYVGQSLADLIDQMHTRHKELLNPAEENTGEPTPGSSASVIDLESFQSEVDQALPAADNDGPALILTNDEGTPEGTVGKPAQSPANRDVEQELGRIMGDIESLLRSHVDRLTGEERARVRAELAERIANVKQAAVREVRKQVESYRDRYRRQHAVRERKLKDQYDKLMGLAHRISRQKAELQRARRHLQVKLEATAQLQAQIDGLRNTLSVDLDALDRADPELPHD